MEFWRCGDCKRIYDIDIDKCIECGNDDWDKISASTYIEEMTKRLKQIEKSFSNTKKIK